MKYSISFLLSLMTIACQDNFFSEHYSEVQLNLQIEETTNTAGAAFEITALPSDSFLLKYNTTTDEKDAIKISKDQFSSWLQDIAWDELEPCREGKEEGATPIQFQLNVVSNKRTVEYYFYCPILLSKNEKDNRVKIVHKTIALFNQNFGKVAFLAKKIE